MNSAATGSMAMTGFPTRAPIELEDRPRQQQWLIDGLWGRQAVGIVGGEPKCGKSFLALDLAVAVAAGVPCLRRFAADQPGRSCCSPPRTPGTSCVPASRASRAPPAPASTPWTSRSSTCRHYASIIAPTVSA